MARLVFTTIGSSGDLFPLIPVARSLRQRGHDVSFAANPWFREPIVADGFAFRPIGPHLGPTEYAAHPEIFSSALGGFAGVRALMRHFVLPHLEAVVRELRDAARGADLLLTHPAQLATPMVAELENLRWLTLSVFPGLLPTRTRAPQGAVLPEILGEWANRLSWWFAGRAMQAAFDRDLNLVRARLGLPPGTDLFRSGARAPEGILLLCSPSYCEPPPDWAHVACTGFTNFDTPHGLEVPREFDVWMSRGPAPVLVSLGTSVAMDGARLMSVARDALDQMGRRGLFLVGQPSNLPGGDGGVHGYFTYVPLSQALRRCSIAVHPGGFGTVAQVLTCGLPSVVVPRAFDQAYHGDQVERLGLGGAVPWARLSTKRLARTILQVDGDEGIRARVRGFAAGLTRESGVETAAAEIERRLERSS